MLCINLITKEKKNLNNRVATALIKRKLYKKVDEKPVKKEVKTPIKKK